MNLKNIPLFACILLINFGGLAIGGWFTGPGVQSDWYAALPKAPWTPPGWVFGAAWTVVMVGFSMFCHAVLSNADSRKSRSRWLGWLTVSWAMNVGWNPLFFRWHLVEWALLEIIGLFCLILWLFFRAWKTHGQRSAVWPLLPYLIWLIIATSLNAYSLAV